MENRIYPKIPTAPMEERHGAKFNSYAARTKFDDLIKKKDYLEKEA